MDFSWRILKDGGFWAALQAVNSQIAGEVALQLQFLNRAYYVTLNNGIILDSSPRGSSIRLSDYIDLILPEGLRLPSSILGFLEFSLGLECSGLVDITTPPWFFPESPEALARNLAIAQKMVFVNAPPSPLRDRFVKGWSLINAGQIDPRKSGALFVDELGEFATPDMDTFPEFSLVLSRYPLESLLKHAIINEKVYYQCISSRVFLPKSDSEDAVFSDWKSLLCKNGSSGFFARIRNGGLRDLVFEIEKKAIEWAVRQGGGMSQNQVAEMLQISRGSLQHKLKKYNLPYLQ